VAIDEQAVRRVDLRPHLHHHVLHVSVDVGHAVEELQVEVAARPLHVQLDDVVGVSRVDYLLDLGLQQLHGCHLVGVAAGYPGPDCCQLLQDVVRPFRYESVGVVGLVCRFQRGGELLLDDDHRREHQQHQAEHPYEVGGLHGPQELRFAISSLGRGRLRGPHVFGALPQRRRVLQGNNHYTWHSQQHIDDFIAAMSHVCSSSSFVERLQQTFARGDWKKMLIGRCRRKMLSCKGTVTWKGANLFLPENLPIFATNIYRRKIFDTQFSRAASKHVSIDNTIKVSRVQFLG
jgi:hypothetical protein